MKENSDLEREMSTFSPDLTEAAQRAITAATSDTRAIHSLDLFWALVDQESRAAEILAAGGLAAEILSDRLPRLQATHRETTPNIESVLHEALRQVPAAGRGGQLGTEHLLWGLVQVDPAVEALLAEHGLAPGTLLPLIDAAAGRGVLCTHKRGGCRDASSEMNGRNRA